MFSTTHLHPMLVHFPIALILLGFVAELISTVYQKDLCFSKIAFYLLIIGTISALFTWLSGVLFTSEMSGSAGNLKESHELFAWITLGLSVTTCILRIYHIRTKKENAKLKWVSFALYALAAISVSVTGYLGGNLVYNFMMPL